MTRAWEVVPLDEDRALVSEAAFAAGDGRAKAVGQLLERYPELKAVRPEVRGAVLDRKLRVGVVAGIPRGLALGLFPTLLVCVTVAAFQTAAAGHLIRTRTRWWSAAGAYAEFALTSLMLLNVTITVLVVSWFVPRLVPQGSYSWVLALTVPQSAPMALALVALFRGWRWPWRLPLHILWLAAVILVNWGRIPT